MNSLPSQIPARQTVKKLTCEHKVFGQVMERFFIYAILSHSIFVFSQSDVVRHALPRHQSSKYKMKLNKLEFAAMNNPIRRYVQDKYEVRMLRDMSSIENIDIALEIGCGNGNGTRLIKKNFIPKNIIAIDVDEKMIKIAKKRNKDKNIVFKVMDASKLDFPNNYFDAVFDLGVIHHIPNWRDCIKEVNRVLKPNGEVILEDLSIETFTTGIGKLWKICLAHPYDAMYTAKQFKEHFNEVGFDIKNYKESNPLGLLRHFSLNAVKK